MSIKTSSFMPAIAAGAGQIESTTRAVSPQGVLENLREFWEKSIQQTLEKIDNPTSLLDQSIVSTMCTSKLSIHALGQLGFGEVTSA